MEPDDGSWEVQNRRRRGKGVAEGSGQGITKFFVSNIPQGGRPWDLANAFRAFGEIAGAFIAKKKDKEGRTFGFVSFKGVSDLEELKRSLSNLKLGGNKLSINVALFARENGVPKPATVVSGHNVGDGKDFVAGQGVFPGLKPNAKGSSSVKKGVSFLDILTNKSHVACEEDEVGVEPSVFSLTDLFGRAVVGRTLGFKELRFLKSSLVVAGFGDATIKYIGGLSVLISFVDKERANRLLLDQEVWGRWFSSLNLWIGQSLPYERLAWVDIHGVPPHLFSPDVFDSIGSKFGKVVQQSQLREDDGDLSFDRLGILVDSGYRINSLLNLKWQDKRYRVWIVEENDQWIPDFVEDIIESEGASSELEGNGGSPVGRSQGVAGHGVSEGEEPLQVPEVDINRREKVGVTVHGGETFSGFDNVGNDNVFKDVQFLGNRDKADSTPDAGGPSFKDNWANLVSHVSPRPIKRKRKEDLFALEDHLDSCELDLNNGPMPNDNGVLGSRQIRRGG
ncbi:putative RNA recognition motif domain, nucleotide-binding alpha-beta plait domain superfamily [Helianthus annuus]|uniref:RNA recognition motif domain, nucleotide-binding alpha-beta plait domain superfamily n=1 Tax=Helianthus annuus TaxID=4232 RepID=A0A9K3ISN6_HELAN|nr:putative RNA recognition motif domain, nucleotide-binding alpha-beta plait domain superfamily [Helianthus annuus]KAJ0560491.1 putative RNA recognition motif domain, nucleotide-binding alpha-beta plait domain superfamily [Helianthus annuus]KAJ0573520.1 putative RNA recognition motif domain, nucleotide-binding alpha-beta plait domain superfamily [Helianthus annuus]KAJ0737883.1 putative RNA recognition motif domain, nucleotide-binding alpha-beta plait domain superfamily [Helianthus annuus]KAJ07